MNRKQRRMMNKEIKKESKKQEIKRDKYLSKKYKAYTTPCCYINSSPVYVGDVVFLKKTDNIGCYDASLKRLIDENHRFVIVYSLYPRTDTIVVCLLSTSKLANQQYRNGIRLTGKYNEYKDVYMDINNYYIIETKYIDKVAYSLTEYDTDNCISCYARPLSSENNLIKGNNFNDKVNSTFNLYKKWISKQFTDSSLERISWLDIHEYVLNLPIEEVNRKIEEAKKADFDNYKLCCYLSAKEGMDILFTQRGMDAQESKVRALLSSLLLSTNDEYGIQSNNLIRNYN